VNTAGQSPPARTCADLRDVVVHALGVREQRLPGRANSRASASSRPTLR
jgi:hypothetical protein